MRFSSSATPQLTPLGVRLMSMSHNKLARLEPPVGGRDRAGILHKSVLVREAVRSAWASLEDGPSELTDWRAPTALGLDTLTEEDEEDEEAAEAAWLDDVLSSMDEQPAAVSVEAEAGWTVSVLCPDADDFDYDDNVQAFTFPDVPLSEDIDEAEALVAYALQADVTVVEVSCCDSESEYGDCDMEYNATSWIELDNDYTPKEAVVQAAADIDEPPFTAARRPVPAPVLTSHPLNTHSLHQAIEAAKRPQFVRADAYSYRTATTDAAALALEPECENTSDDESSCPDLVVRKRRPRPRNPRGGDPYDSDSDSEDDSPCRTPPLSSFECEDLEVTSPNAKAGSFWDSVELESLAI